VEEWISMREWARQGVAITEIARRSGHDPKTVRKMLRQPAPAPRLRTGQQRSSKLEPYRAYLKQRVAQGCLNGTVLLEGISAQGYTGKHTILRAFLAPLRQEARRQREATVRFETGPAQQAQVDWGSFGRIWSAEAEGWQKLWAFVFTLSYSRAQYLAFVTSCDEEHFLACHLGAFGALGIPEQILYDNLKTATLGRQADGTPIFQRRFLDFALYYGFPPKLCQPYRPQTKGKVERGIRSVRQNFWVRVAADVAAGALDLAELNERAADWVSRVANQRRHGTTGEVVQSRLQEEQPRLGTVTARPRYDTDYHALRRVGRDGRLSYRGRVYQVPLAHALQTIQVGEALDGSVTLRALEGQRLPTIGVLTAPGPGRPAALLESVPEVGAPQQGPAPATVLPRAGPPVVTRDLQVYEEVAHAARVG
jgi:transposase